MSTPRPDLRARIQSVLAEKGPVPAKHIQQYFPGIDRGALDCALSALMRDNKIGRELGAYDVIRPRKPVAKEGGPPPSRLPLERVAQMAQLSPEAQQSIAVTAIKVTAPVVERPKPAREACVALVQAEPAIEINETSVEANCAEPVITGYFLERIKTRRQEAVDANFRAATELLDLQTKSAGLREAIAKREAYIARCDEFFAQSKMLAEGAG